MDHHGSPVEIKEEHTGCGLAFGKVDSHNHGMRTCTHAHTST